MNYRLKSLLALATCSPACSVAIAGVLCAGVASATMSPYQTVLALDTFGLRPETYSILLIAGSVISVMATVVVGAVSDTSPQYRVPILILTAIAGAACYAVLFIFRSDIVFSVTWILLLATSSTMISQNFAMLRVHTNAMAPEQRHLILATARAFLSLAWTIVPPMAALLLWLGYSLISVTLIALGSYLVYLCAVVLSHRSLATAAQRTNGSKRPALVNLMSVSTLSPILAVGTLDATLKLYGLAFPLLLLQTYGGTVELVGLSGGAIALAEIPLILAWSMVLKRRESRQVLALAALIEAFHLIVILAIPSLNLYLPWLFGHAVAASAIMSISIGHLQGVLEHHPGVGSSLMSVAGLFGSTIAAALFGLFASTYGPVGLTTMAAGLALLGSVLISNDRSQQLSRSTTA